MEILHMNSIMRKATQIETHVAGTTGGQAISLVLKPDLKIPP